MKKHLSLVAAAALAVGGMGLIGHSYAQQTDDQTAGQKADQAAQDAGQSAKDAANQAGQSMQNAGQKTGEAAREAGERMNPTTQPGAMGTMQPAPDANEIRSDLSKVSDAALSKDPIDKIAGWCVKADKDRLESGKDQARNIDVGGTAQAFRNDWKSKYNQDFDLAKAKEVALANFQIMAGTLGETAQPAGGRMNPDQSGQTGDMNQPGQTGMTAPQAGADRNHATVIIPADPQHNLPQVTVHLVNEGKMGDAWRLDIPDNVDAQKLASLLKDHLYALGQDKNNWPSDPNQAYSVAAHHMFAALEGIPVGGTQQMGGQTGQ